MPTRVLIVDDDRGVRDALRQLLEYEGHEVQSVTSGAEALEAALLVIDSLRSHAAFVDKIDTSRCDPKERAEPTGP